MIAGVRRFNWASATLVSLPLWFSACHGGDDGRPLGADCNADAPCKDDLTCAYGRCRASCHQDSDCPEGACLPRAEGQSPAACGLASERPCSGLSCPEGTVCGLDLTCRAACGSGATCSGAAICYHEVCYDDVPDAGEAGVDSGDSGADSGDTADADADASEAAADADADASEAAADAESDAGDAASDAPDDVPIDTEEPSVCGDGDPTGTEVCDDGINDGAYGGCMPGCMAFAPRCGDNAINGGEACDGTALYGQTCLSLGYAFGGGTLNCKSDCTGFDLSTCDYLLQDIVYDEPTSFSSIHTMDRNGANRGLVFELPAAQGAANLDVSPDGTKILYTNPALEGYYYYDLVTKEHVHVLDFAPPPFQGDPARWINDDEIAIIWGTDKGHSDLRRVSIAGGAPTLWIDPASVNRWAMQWFDLSPDQTRVAFLAKHLNWGPTSDLYLIDPDGVSNPTVVWEDTDNEDDSVEDYFIAWHPDGASIIATRSEGLSFGDFPTDLVRYDVATGAITVIAAAVGQGLTYMGLIGSDYAVVNKRVSSYNELFRVTLQTGDVLNLTNTPTFGEGGFTTVKRPCGNGLLQPQLGEECDNGPNNSDTTPDACRTTCRDPACGDGTVDTGEVTGCWEQAPGSPYTVVIPGGEPAVADIDFNGYRDVVVGAGATESWILKGSAAGLTHTGTLGFSMRYPVLTKCDGDQRVDLLSPIGATGNVAIMLGDGQGGFTPTVTSPIVHAGDYSRLRAADFDDDGKTDFALIVYEGTQPATLFIYEGSGDGSFTQTSAHAIGPTPLDLRIGDLDGDAKLDIAIVHGHSSGSGISVFLGDGSGGFALSPSSPVLAGHALFGIDLGDLDGDADLDAVVTCGYEDHVHVMLNDGTSALTEASGSPLSVYEGRGLALGDLDGDTDLDLVVPDASAGVHVFLNDGTALFMAAAGSPYPMGNAPLVPVLADMDNNGFLDLVQPTQSGELHVILNKP